jgi:hypothetical protein
VTVPHTPVGTVKSNRRPATHQVLSSSRCGENRHPARLFRKNKVGRRVQADYYFYIVMINLQFTQGHHKQSTNKQGIGMGSGERTYMNDTT